MKEEYFNKTVGMCDDVGKTERNERRSRMTNCNECAQNEILENACLGILSKFQNDLIEFAKYNWAPSHVDMLERAIECVCKGERTYPNEEESEE